MFPIMQSVREAHDLAIKSDLALIRSRQAREYYIQGMRDQVGDDELRHRHYDALDASVIATTAHNVRLGQRKVQFHA